MLSYTPTAHLARKLSSFKCSKLTTQTIGRGHKHPHHKRPLHRSRKRSAPCCIRTWSDNMSKANKRWLSVCSVIIVRITTCGSVFICTTTRACFNPRWNHNRCDHMHMLNGHSNECCDISRSNSRFNSHTLCNTTSATGETGASCTVMPARRACMRTTSPWKSRNTVCRRQTHEQNYLSQTHRTQYAPEATPYAPW